MPAKPGAIVHILQAVHAADRAAAANLFGLRIDDEARGGDDDLLVESQGHLPSGG